jgi:hypothetical protein
VTSAVFPATRVLHLDDLYVVAAHGPEVVMVPDLAFAMIDGRGDPTTSDDYVHAIGALEQLNRALRCQLDTEIGLDHRVGALEGLWWTDDMSAFAMDHKTDLHWTMMIAQPEAVTPERFERARAELGHRKVIPALGAVRLKRYAEGECAQVLYAGPFREEGPTISRLHAYIDGLGGLFDGHRQKHHEIYLGDPTDPESWRTIIRQPFARG